MVDNDKTVVLVSGATGVIGHAIARELAATPNYEVVLVARDAGRARKAVDAIRSDTANHNLRFVLADLCRRRSIQALADSWQGPLHVLVNDAGVAPREHEVTPENIELTFATNVLGYFWMTHAFRPILSRNLGFGGSQAPRDAAHTPVMLARGELGTGITGRYFEHGSETRCQFAGDRKGIERLYDLCLAYE